MRRIFFSLFFLLTACAEKADVEPVHAPTQAGSLQPYLSPVPSITPPPHTPAPTQTPLPTPTPHLYQVVAGDTMGSISLEFGVSINDLIAANPDVQPSAMSVGQSLVIPDGTDQIISLPTLESLALELSPPDCYPTFSGGMWCFLSVQNRSASAVENISADIRLYDDVGNLLVNKVAFSLVDRLLIGDSLAMPIFFAGVPTDARAEASLLSALPISDGETRYLNASLRNVLTQIAWDGMSAEISGDIVLEETPSRLWMVAIAYDNGGKVVGARRWEFASGERSFELTVASLGNEIENVDLMVEAKP